MRVKGVLQNDINDCGVACLATVCSYFNYKVPLIKIRELIKCPEEGISILDICKAAEKLNLNTEALYGTWEELYNEIILTHKLPIIVHTETNEGYQHYIVVYKYFRKKVFVFDPGEGHKVYSRREFCDIWSGYLITFKPEKSFSKYKYINHYKKYIDVVWENKKYICLSIFLFTVIIGLEVIGAMTYQIVIDRYVLGSRDTSFIGQISLIKDNIHIVFFSLIFIYIISFFVEIVGGKIIARITRKTNETFLNAFFVKLLKLPISYFTERKEADLLNRFSTIKIAGNVFVNSLIKIITDILLIVTSLCVLSYINKELLSIVLIIILLYILVVHLYKKPMQINSRKIVEAENEVLVIVKEVLDGIETIKAMGNEEEETQKFYIKNKKSLEKILSGNDLYITKSGIELYIEQMGNIIIFWIGSMLVIQETITLGELIVFQALVSFLLRPIQGIVELQQDIQNGITYFRRLDDVYEAKEELNNVSNKLKDGIKNIECIDLGFSYVKGQKCLKNFNLNIESGEKIALIGKSGSGKSTLLKLITKLYEPDDGDILINGLNIREISRREISSKILLVSQNMTLFADTIRNNLLMGNYQITDEDIESVIDICGLEEVFQKHHLTLESRLPENGSNLSSGERQRLIMARGLLRKPEVMVIDEITSHLDEASERNLWDKLFKQYSDVTFIIISHRMNVVDYVKRVCVINDGKIVSDVCSRDFCREVVDE